MGLIFLIGAYSIGGFFDPVTSGISFRAGQFMGLRVHIVGAFSEGEKQITAGSWWYDSIGYHNNEHQEWKPCHSVNAELRLEYYFHPQGWFQPYIGVGWAYKDARNWVNYSKWEADSSYYVVAEKKENYQSAVSVLGIEINYFAELAKGTPFIEDITFVIEFPVIYYKFKEKSVIPPEDGYYDENNSGRTSRSGIGGGLGIHYNF